MWEGGCKGKAEVGAAAVAAAAASEAGLAKDLGWPLVGLNAAAAHRAVRAWC